MTSRYRGYHDIECFIRRNWNQKKRRKQKKEGLIYFLIWALFIHLFCSMRNWTCYVHRTTTFSKILQRLCTCLTPIIKPIQSNLVLHQKLLRITHKCITSSILGERVGCRSQTKRVQITHVVRILPLPWRTESQLHLKICTWYSFRINNKILIRRLVYKANPWARTSNLDRRHHSGQ